jgi:hypothetical protein
MRNMAALVIGNAAYRGGNRLANPTNDATDFGAKLRSYGFEVLIATDCAAREMDKHLKSFRQLLTTHEVGLFFFAGHGVQIEGINYLIALDTDTDSETDAKHSSLSLDKFIDVMAKSQASTKIIILDACRNNPWERKWHRGANARGLASVYAPKGTIIGYATSPGEVASDGVGRNGTYTAALLQHIDANDCPIERCSNASATPSQRRRRASKHLRGIRHCRESSTSTRASGNSSRSMMVGLSQMRCSRSTTPNCPIRSLLGYERTIGISRIPRCLCSTANQFQGWRRTAYLS